MLFKSFVTCFLLIKIDVQIYMAKFSQTDGIQISSLGIRKIKERTRKMRFFSPAF
jgi:hypothetical protein